MLELLRYPFMTNALLAGILVAAAAGPCGYILVARNLTFAGHALPSIGFAGAAGAVLAGVQPVYGLLAFSVAAGVGVGIAGEDLRERDIGVGIVMTLALGLGLLFLSLYSGYAQRIYAVLFGSILGISATAVRLTAAGALFVLAAFAALYRPLLFSTFDPASARARGVPVRLLSVLFMIMVSVVISIAVQVMGALLVFTLLVGPAATLSRLVHRPSAAILGSVALGIAYVTVGILLAAASNRLPVSFFVASVSFAVYLPVRLATPQEA
ncbi:MAG TPA: metal ABC transporter permease [Spirochaetia bacterium]